MPNDPKARTHADPPSNAFVPVPQCWICTVVEAVAQAAWIGEGGLTLRDWLSVTASGMHHRMHDHGMHPHGTASNPHGN
ncbi:hypothetical protein [Streptomyces mirabilis]|uniref:hypothetical protein n=1 Tax=Streptomyces mirabilis TaxID=68239 RepID=UPI0022595605|nr:hypothetical protein [Streptomyces mirabilis]MCX4420300.1 hypothetical protein [Streptomyces mirabilis]